MEENRQEKFRMDFHLPIVCLTCYGRSGSVLLQGLFDNHPQVISVPSHAMMEIEKFMQNKAFTDTTDIPTLIDRFIRTFPYLFRETDQSRPLRIVASMVTIGVPVKKFTQALNDILTSLSPRHTEPAIFFRAVHYAYDLALGRDIRKTKIIVWQRHSPFLNDNYKIWLIENIGNMRFLVPVRQPEVTLSSHFDYKNYAKDLPSTLKETSDLILQLTAAGRVHSQLDSISRAVKFEHVHGNTERVTKAMADWIGIDWNPTMLEPTVDGKEQLFPKDETVVRGVNKSIEKKQRAPHFSFFDRLVFQAINRSAYRNWGYSTLISSDFINDIIAFVGVHIPLRMEFEKFKIDLEEMNSMRAALRSAFKRRRETLRALKNLNSVNAAKTSYKILNLLS